MKYSLPTIALFAFASITSAQVVHEPVRLELYNPYYDKLNLQAIHRLRILQEPAPVTNLVVNVDGRLVHVQRDSGRVPGFVYPVQDSVSVDPQTGEALFFRMSDLLPPVGEADRGDDRDAQERRGRAADTDVATPPSAERQPTQVLTPLPGMAKKGEIIIKPYQPKR